MPPRSYIEAMDRPTVLYILYTMVSAQQTNLLPKNASRNDAIFAQKVYRIFNSIQFNCDCTAIIISYTVQSPMFSMFYLILYICTLTLLHVGAL